jgi:hypothetical protein
VRLVQVATQDVGDGVFPSRAPSASALVTFIGGLKLAGYLGDMAVQLTQQNPRLGAPHILHHVRIVSSILNLRALTSQIAKSQISG